MSELATVLIAWLIAALILGPLVGAFIVAGSGERRERTRFALKYRFAKWGRTKWQRVHYR